MKSDGINLLSKSKVLPEKCYIVIIKYLELDDIVNKISALNKHIRNIVLAENYILFKHFVRYFNLHSRLKKSDIPAKVDILQLIKKNIDIKKT